MKKFVPDATTLDPTILSNIETLHFKVRDCVREYFNSNFPGIRINFFLIDREFTPKMDVIHYIGKLIIDSKPYLLKIITPITADLSNSDKSSISSQIKQQINH